MLVRRPSVRRRVPHRVRVVVVKVPPRTLHASGRYHQWWCKNAKYDRMLVHVLIVKYNNNNNDHIANILIILHLKYNEFFFFFCFESCSVLRQKQEREDDSDFRRRKEEDKKEVISSSFPDVLPWKRRRTAAATTTTTTRDDDDDENTIGNDENDDPSSRMEITHEPLFRTPSTYTRKTIFFYSSSFKQQRTNWGVTETTEKKVGRCKSENER